MWRLYWKHYLCYFLKVSTSFIMYYVLLPLLCKDILPKIPLHCCSIIITYNVLVCLMDFI